ncbi:T9SS type B sorting domain-containing protein, partial [Muricauda sp. CAU 1633]|uniref:T9SS type B sorting domain-containing protein n=1 Tax=Allomuricauda sp. CAU 1633 TaxID=2816036 RepID=UPI001A8D5422
VGAGGAITGGNDGDNYTITATNTDGCATDSAPFAFDAGTQLPSPAAPAITVTPEDCAGDATNTVDNYDNTLTYTSSPVGLAVGAGGAITGGNDGDNYTITATNTDGCATDSAPFAFDAGTQLGFNISTNVQHETCWESTDGAVSVDVDTSDLPLTVQLNSMQPIVFASNSFNIDDLPSGNYNMTIIDSSGCQSNTAFEILPGGPNLGATVEPIYSCDSGLPSNGIAVTLFDTSIANDVLYALDTTNPNDFVISPDFENISAGNHTLSIMHNNGCLLEIPFAIDDIAPLSLVLTNVNINEITATVSGGTPTYTYFFDDNLGTSSNTFTIDRSGTFVVRVVDGYGCETSESITMNLIEITIPNFFTPNNDGQNDFWKPRNMELFPNIQTFIFDRYGRKLKIMGQLDSGWDGQYQSQAMPSGDYWYIVELNDGSGREFVGHFTLYR